MFQKVDNNLKCRRLKKSLIWSKQSSGKYGIRKLENQETEKADEELSMKSLYKK